MIPRLLSRYHEEVHPALLREFNYRNVMEVPRVTKVVVNIGLGEALGNARALDAAAEDMATITGQKPVITRAKTSIANFKVREGNQIGVTCTLRGQRMWEFLDRTINAALPRIRDFRGVARTAFDGRGNYSLGLREADHLPRSRLRCRGSDPRLASQHRHYRSQRRGRPAPSGVARDAARTSRIEESRCVRHRSDRRHADSHPQRSRRAPMSTSWFRPPSSRSRSPMS